MDIDEKAWREAWHQSGCSRTMRLDDFQMSVMFGSIKIKWKR